MSFYREYFSKPVVWYVYPLWHKVSFTLVGQKHVEQLKKYYRLYEVDELSFLPRDIFVNPIVVIHPYFYIITRYTQLFFNYYDKFKAVIGIEVADSDRLSPYAIRLANMTHAIVVPSNFSKEAFINSGCKVPVYVVPHGISKLFFRPKRYPQHPLIRKLFELKQRDNLIYVLFFLIHSGYRKGAHLVYVVLKEIQKTWKNVVLICKAGGFGGHDVQLLATLRSHIIVQWFSENDLVDLYDICDIYTLFSIGGGFELNGLEALSRGLVVLACEKGSWTDYLPDFLLIPYSTKVQVFPDANPVTSIHCGYGYQISIPHAIDKLHDVLNNLDDYKARVREYWQKVAHNWTWETVGLKLKNIIDKFVS